MAEIREKCAVVGVSLKENSSAAAHLTYQALFALQHRGVEGSGIAALTPDGSLHAIRKPGMVRDVFQSEDLLQLTGTTAVGQNRYSTNGRRDAHLQPVISRDIGFAFAHNGNIPDTSSLCEYLEKRRYMTSELNDSEMFGKALASKLHGGREILDAVREVQELATGAYSCVAAYGNTLFAFRDPHGIRPLEMGSVDGGLVFASETCALDSIGAKWLRSVMPGELILVQDGVLIGSYQLQPATPHLDMFELVYFARHDSYLVGERVNEVRRRFGYALAGLHSPHHKDTSNCVVIPVPDTSVPAAEGYAEKTGLTHEAAIIKNRYVGRTFMQPSQDSRRKDLSRKHTLIEERIKGRDIYLIDDSIVRGNTLPRLVKAARECGAKSVSVLIASPPVRFPDFYGIDTPHQDDLLAANLSVEKMRQHIGADYLGFLSVDALVAATGKPADTFNLAAFTGKYPVSIGARKVEVRKPTSMEYAE